MTNVDKLIQLAKEVKQCYNADNIEGLIIAEDELLYYISNEFMEEDDE